MEEFELYLKFFLEYRYFLEQHQEYEEAFEESCSISWDYSVPANVIQLVRERFYQTYRRKVDEDELSLVLRALRFTYEKLICYEGATGSAESDHILELLKEVSRSGNRLRVNCIKHATVLTELLLCLGYQARTIICLPMGTFPYDNHCITCVKIPSLRQWVALDPSYNFYFQNEEGRLLSAQELRDAVIQETKVVVCSNARIKVSGTEYIQEHYMQYMAKNLFRFRACVQAYVKERKEFVELVPKGYLPECYETDTKEYGVKYITRRQFFWGEDYE